MAVNAAQERLVDLFVNHPVIDSQVLYAEMVAVLVGRHVARLKLHQLSDHVMGIGHVKMLLMMVVPSKEVLLTLVTEINLAKLLPPIVDPLPQSPRGVSGRTLALALLCVVDPLVAFTRPVLEQMPAMVLLEVLVPLLRLPRLAKETEHASLLLRGLTIFLILLRMVHPLVVLVSTKHAMPMKHALTLLWCNSKTVQALSSLLFVPSFATAQKVLNK